MIEPAPEFGEGFYKMTAADWENVMLPILRKCEDEEREERRAKRAAAKRKREERYQLTMNI